jgi:hypothetical protein
LDYALRRFGWWSNPCDIAAVLSERKEFQAIDDKAGIATRIRLMSVGNWSNPDLKGILQITFRDILQYMKDELFMSYGKTDELKTIVSVVSDHKQWDTLICQVYNRLLGHKVPEQSVAEVLKWLFPNEPDSLGGVGPT